MNRIKTITKSFGILALILTFALNLAAQQSNVTIKVSGKKPGSEGNTCVYTNATLSYNSSSNSVKVEIGNLCNSSYTFRQAYLTDMYGNNRSLSRTYSSNGSRTFSVNGNGMLYTLVLVDYGGRRHRLRFYAN